MSKIIEIFIDASDQSQILLNKVQKFACSKCKLIVHDITTFEGEQEYHKISEEQGSLLTVPMVVMDGRVMDAEKIIKIKKTGSG